MVEASREHLERVRQAGDDARRAGEDLLAYIEQLEEILDAEEDTMRRQRLVFLAARYYRLKSQWRIKLFDYLAVQGHSAQEIRSLLSSSENQ